MVGVGVLGLRGRSRQPDAPDTPDTHRTARPLRFFSLPHWTRRTRTADPPRKPRPLLEKDLPPTPVDTDHPTARVSIAVQPLFPPSQINSVAFTSLPDTSTENVLRKTKSTLSLRPRQHPSGVEQQRTRGVSLTHLFGTPKRESTSPSVTPGSSPVATLARKPSFWSRRLLSSSPQHLSVPLEPHSDPTIQRVDLSPELLARTRSNSSGAALSRRPSELHPSKARAHTPAAPHSPLARDRTNVRPSTADPYLHVSRSSPARRPATADSTSRSRSRSLFTSPQSSPVPHPPLAANPTLSKVGPPNIRPRSSTNPPLLHRLSINLFASSPSSVTKNGTFISNGAMPSPASGSPRPSLSQIPPDVLKPRADESPETFVSRMVSLVSKAEIAGVLASAGDPFHADSLKLFVDRFDFHGDPLDVALRRLLMHIGLPRETQQIDRVIETFGKRYLSCNPDLFTSADHPYILAFSLIMLHTDAFNKSNRRKMSKADYVKNTTLPGLIPEVLDCFYDNIVFAPFIFIEDPFESEGSVEGNLTRPSTSSGLPSPMVQGGNPLFSRPKIDPYYLITNNLLHQLRVNVEGQISPENPFRWDGTGSSWNYDEILLYFARGRVVQIGLTETRSTTPFFGLNVGGIPSPSLSSLGGAASETWTIKFTKVAVLNRKDDFSEGGKKPSSRKWRPFSVALTRSSLLLFRDLSWASALLSWSDLPRKAPIASASFKPDEIISLNGALAILDRSYSKHLNTFHLATHDGRRILFQTTEEKEMNEWISCINYASAFKTTGIRMRALGMTGKVLELTGVAAATSHLHDLQLSSYGQSRTLAWNNRNISEPMDQLASDGRSQGEYCSYMDSCQSESVELSAPEVERTSQFQETFDTVKAELATARISAKDLSVVEKTNLVGPESPRLASRSRLIRARVEDLEDRICAANAQIDSSMHITRNIAILAPFQNSTRERLQDTIQIISRKIQSMRLDVTRLICHRNILLNDLAVEERNFKQATSLALQVATETLQQRYSEYAIRTSFSSQELRPKRSSHEESPPSGSHSFSSSAYETFRPALDFGPAWPSSGETFAGPSLWGAPLPIDSPVTQGFDGSTSCYPSPEEISYLSLSTTNQSLPDTSLQENSPVVLDSEELAEEWNKTRAAKRVSLVKLPPDLRMSVIAGKSSRLQRNDLLEEEPMVGTLVT